MIIGGRIDNIGILKNLNFLNARVSTAEMNVASVPTIRSIGLNEDRLEIKQPIVSAGMAYGEKTGSTVSASEKRNCIGPNANPNAKEMYVSAT